MKKSRKIWSSWEAELQRVSQELFDKVVERCSLDEISIKADEARTAAKQIDEYVETARHRYQ